MKNNALVTVKNNREGRRLIALLRKHLRNTPKGVQVYGRGPRPPECYPRYLPQAKAKGFAVYIFDKPKTRLVQVAVTKMMPGPMVETTVQEWKHVPTKWADKPTVQ